MSEKLLPCPFCGTEARFYENAIDFVTKWSVSCAGCDVNLDACEDDKAGAASIWNTRRTPAPSGSMPDQEGLHQIIYKHLYRCLDGGVVPDGFLTGDLWKATEAAAAEIKGAAPPARSAAISAEPATDRPYYKRASAALQAAHQACFNHPDLDVLGMSHGPFSGVNVALGIVTQLETENQALRAALARNDRGSPAT